MVKSVVLTNNELVRCKQPVVSIMCFKPLSFFTCGNVQ